jgi:hypothetical protein
MKTLMLRNCDEYQEEISWLMEYFNEKTAAAAIRRAVVSFRDTAEKKNRSEMYATQLEIVLERIQYIQSQRELHRHNLTETEQDLDRCIKVDLDEIKKSHYE